MAENHNPNRLKVVHLNASSAGGAFVAAQRLSQALSQLPNVDSEHWVFEGAEGEFYRWAEGWLKQKWAFGLHALEKLDFLRYERDRSVRFAFSHGKTGVSVSTWDALSNADVIHLHWINKGFVSLSGLQDLTRLGKKIIWTCHDMWPFTGGCYHPRGCDHFEKSCGDCHYLKHPSNSDLSGRVFSAKQRIYRSAESRIQFVTPSAWLKEQALKSAAPTLQQKEAIAVIPNPIDTTYFCPKEDSLESEDVVITTNPLVSNQAEDAGEKPFVLMFAAANLGNVAKGFAEFQSICNALHDAGKRRIHALVVGENRLGNLRELGLRCEYSELGFIANSQAMREAYWQSDVYVTTSHEENLPTTIMESLSCGVPVAAFAVGGIPEMIQSEGSGQTGWLAPKLDIQPLVESLLQYSLSSVTDHVALKARCRRAAIANYGAKSIAEQYLRLYQQN